MMNYEFRIYNKKLSTFKNNPLALPIRIPFNDEHSGKPLLNFLKKKFPKKEGWTIYIFYLDNRIRESLIKIKNKKWII